MEDKNYWDSFKAFLRDKFNLDEDRAEQSEVVENVRRGVEFKGTNLWVLIFAIVVASVGLNVNSAAVIIGAMLISPIMGPIMGIGLSLGINDFELFKKSLRNFLFAVGVSLMVSTLYFMVSPLSVAQSELLARTTPTIWDVLIATFGGLAGIVAQSRKDRTSTVIPGVAIATALMPPLCTAGYGLATGQWNYFGGAFYLFFINAVFIAFSTFFIVRFLKYDRKQLLDAKRAKKVKRYMMIIVTATLVPSIIMAYSIVQRTLFETSAQKFVKEVLVFPRSEVVNVSYHFAPQERSIELTVIGEVVSQDVLDIARGQMVNYNLKEVTLVVKQASIGTGIDNSKMQHLLVSSNEMLNQKNAEVAALEQRLQLYENDTISYSGIARELGALWPTLESVAIGRAPVTLTTGQQQSEVLICMVRTRDNIEITPEDDRRLRAWLSERTRVKQVVLMVKNK